MHEVNSPVCDRAASDNFQRRDANSFPANTSRIGEAWRPWPAISPPQQGGNSSAQGNALGSRVRTIHSALKGRNSVGQVRPLRGWFPGCALSGLDGFCGPHSRGVAQGCGIDAPSALQVAGGLPWSDTDWCPVRRVAWLLQTGRRFGNRGPGRGRVEWPGYRVSRLRLWRVVGPPQRAEIHQPRTAPWGTGRRNSTPPALKGRNSLRRTRASRPGGLG